METVLGCAVGGALVFVLFRYMSRRNFSKGGAKTWSFIRRQKEFTIAVSPKEALERAKEAVKFFSMKLQMYEPERGCLTALTGMNWSSMGEIIAITLKEAPGGTQVLVESRPAIRFQLNDFGRNQANVERVAKLMAK